MPALPQPAESHLPRLQALLEQGDFEGAASAAKQAAVSFAPGPVRVLLAMVLFAAGHRDEAIAELERCERSSSSNARFCHAALLRASGRPQAALAALRQLASSPGQQGNALASSAELRVVYHDNEGALDDITRALEALPTHPLLHLMQASILERLGDIERGRAAALEASRLPLPPFQRVMVARQLTRLGLFDDAWTLLDQACDARDDRAVAAAEQARLALFRDDRKLAQRLVDAALACNALQPVALMVRGVLCARAGDTEQAIALLGQAIDLDPSCPEARLHRAEIRLRQGDTAATLADLDAATYRDPESFAAHALRLLAGMCRTESHIPPYASESIRQGVENLASCTLETIEDGASPRVARGLEVALSALAGNRSSSLSKVRGEGDARGLEWVGPIVTPRFAAKWAAESCVVVGPAVALDRLDRVVQAYPTSTKPLCYRGELRLWFGDTAGAHRDFKEAISRDVSTKWAHIGLVAAYTLEGRYDEALEAAEWGLTHVGPGPTLYIHRGEAHRRKGNFDAALADITHAAMQPSRVSAFVNLGLLQIEQGDQEGLARTISRLSWQARWLFLDAAASLGAAHPARVAPRALLERCLEMMRGNRSSSCITYFFGDELRVVPFVRSPDTEPTLVATRRALAKASLAQPRPGPRRS